MTLSNPEFGRGRSKLHPPMEGGRISDAWAGSNRSADATPNVCWRNLWAIAIRAALDLAVTVREDATIRGIIEALFALTVEQGRRCVIRQ